LLADNANKKPIFMLMDGKQLAGERKEIQSKKRQKAAEKQLWINSNITDFHFEKKSDQFLEWLDKSCNVYVRITVDRNQHIHLAENIFKKLKEKLPPVAVISSLNKKELMITCKVRIPKPKKPEDEGVGDGEN